MLPLVPLIGLVRMPCTCSPCSRHGRDHLVERTGAVAGIGDHALPVEAPPAHLELGLHEQHQVGIRTEQAGQVTHDERERDERQVGDDEVGRTTEVVRR